MQLFNQPSELHCSTGQGGMHFPLFSAALPKRLTAGLCQGNYTYHDLRFIQKCSEPTELHCSTVLGKVHFPLLSTGLQNRLTAGLCHRIYKMEICSSHRCAASQQNCTAALFRAKCIPHCSVLLCKKVSQQAWVSRTYGHLLVIQLSSNMVSRD